MFTSEHNIDIDTPHNLQVLLNDFEILRDYVVEDLKVGIIKKCNKSITVRFLNKDIAIFMELFKTLQNLSEDRGYMFVAPDIENKTIRIRTTQYILNSVNKGDLFIIERLYIGLIEYDSDSDSRGVLFPLTDKNKNLQNIQPTIEQNHLVQVSSGTESLRKVLSTKPLSVPEYTVLSVSDILPVPIGDILQNSINSKAIFQGSRYSYPQAWGDFWELLILRDCCIKLGFSNSIFISKLKFHCNKIINLFVIPEYDMTETFFNEELASIDILEDIWTMVFIKSIVAELVNHEYVFNRVEKIPMFYENVFDRDKDTILINELCSTSIKISDWILSLSDIQHIDIDMSTQIITKGLNGIPDIRVSNNVIDIKCYPNYFGIKTEDHLQILTYCAMYKTKGIHIDNVLFINPLTGYFAKLEVSDWVEQYSEMFMELLTDQNLVTQYDSKILSNICNLLFMST